MPCLLRDLTNIKKFLPRSSVAVFVVHFSDDCAPNGTFIGSLSCLLSAHGWKICRQEDGTPQCLAHNIVSLHGPNMPAKITYVNATSHFQLHILCSNATAYASIFPQIRNTIFRAIQTTFNVMRFKRVTIQDAFLCNCHLSRSNPHAAILCYFKQNFYLQCSRVTEFNCAVNDSHTIWIEGQGGKGKGKWLYYRVKD